LAAKEIDVAIFYRKEEHYCDSQSWGQGTDLGSFSGLPKTRRESESYSRQIKNRRLRIKVERPHQDDNERTRYPKT